MRTFEFTEGLPKHWQAKGVHLGLWRLLGVYSGPEVDTPDGGVLYGHIFGEARAREQIRYWIKDTAELPRAEWLSLDTYGADYDDMRAWLIRDDPEQLAAEHPAGPPWIEDVPDNEVACRVQEQFPGGLKAFAADADRAGSDRGSSAALVPAVVAAVMVLVAVGGVLLLTQFRPGSPASMTLAAASTLLLAGLAVVLYRAGGMDITEHVAAEVEARGGGKAAESPEFPALATVTPDASRPAAEVLTAEPVAS